MTISKSTFRANVYSDVRTVINTKVPDPKLRGKQWIFSTLPDLTTNFVGYPIIILSPANRNKLRELFDNSYYDDSTPIIITIYYTKKVDVDTLSDSVDTVMIPSNFTQFTFNDYNEDTNNIKLNGQNVHTRTMSYFVEVNY